MLVNGDKKTVFVILKLKIKYFEWNFKFIKIYCEAAIQQLSRFFGFIVDQSLFVTHKRNFFLVLAVINHWQVTHYSSVWDKKSYNFILNIFARSMAIFKKNWIGSRLNFFNLSKISVKVTVSRIPRIVTNILRQSFLIRASTCTINSISRSKDFFRFPFWSHESVW